MVEVFKTNIKNKKSADFILNRLQDIFPNYKINFDLEDCDNILRVENRKQTIDVYGIMDVVWELGFNIEILPDTMSPVK